MYLLYVDESDTTNKTPRWYCMTGVYVLDRSHGPITEKFENLIKTNNLNSNFEIKGEELYNGNGNWKGAPIERRIDFCKQVCNFINQSNIKLYSALKIVKNDDHVSTYKNLLNEVLLMAAKQVSKASKTGRQLILIFDERPDIKKEIRNQIKCSRAEIIQKYKRSCRFIDYGYDADSRLCWGIQIADFVSYLLRKQKTRKPGSDTNDPTDHKILMNMVDDCINSIQRKCKIKELN